MIAIAAIYPTPDDASILEIGHSHTVAKVVKN